jgi:hypothetical protein
MKIQVLTALAVLTGALNFAHAGQRCGGPASRACNEFVSRFDAIKRLNALEGDMTQATENLSLIESVEATHKMGLDGAVDNFIFLQESLGGATATFEARNAFSLIAKNTGRRASLYDLTTVYTDLYRSEGDAAQTREDFILVLTGAKNLGLFPATELFGRTLETLGGATATYEAQSVYKMLLGESSRYSPRELLGSFRQIYKAEGDVAQAKENMALVIQAAKKCGSLKIAAQDFLDVLQESGGATGTYEAQKLYKNLYKL